MNVDYRYIETFTGKKFHIDNPSNINIEDIAHALSMQCRYTGHCSKFYSVAEHSYWASFIVPQRYAKSALLHDASEAYIADISSPFKPLLTNYREIEDSIMEVVAKTFELPHNFHEHPAVKDADVQALKLEAYHLMKSKGEFFLGIDNIEFADIFSPEVIGYEDIGFTPEEAKSRFLDRYRALRNNVM